MAISIAIQAHKGGVGKTMLTFNLAGAMVEQGKKVLLVDMDQQADLSKLLVGRNPDVIKPTVKELIFEKDVSTPDTILISAVSGMDIIPVNSLFRGIEVLVSQDPDTQFYLADKLAVVKDQYDFILIDCPTPIEFATRAAFIASDFVMTPVTCDNASIKNVNKTLELISQIQTRANPTLRFLGYVVNRYQPFSKDSVVQREYLELIRKTFNPEVFSTIVKEYTIYKESLTLYKPITSYSPKSQQADCFRTLLEEVLEWLLRND